MSDLSARLSLPFIAPSQAQKHVTHNEALQQLDLLVQMRVEEFDIITPPAAPAPGAFYALGTGAQGDWAGQDGQLAAFIGETWLFLAPQEGWQAIDLISGSPRMYRDGGWQNALDQLESVGIGTTADTVNRLAVAAEATLLSHDGTGHQLKINKAATAETASLLFQTNWDGHAEMGLTGDDAFSIKVSPDNTTWIDALTLDQTTGKASGAAIQAGPSDNTADCLLKVGAFGLGLGEGQQTEITADLDATDLISGATLYGGGSTLGKPLGRNGAGIVWRGWGGQAAGAGEQHQLYGVRIGPGSTPDMYYRSLDTNGVWADWVRLCHTGNLVGTVSQSSGTPTGAVIERGSNANGNYVRFADGTQICTRLETFSFTTSAVGTIHRDFTTAGAWTFPASFTAEPACYVNAQSVAAWAQAGNANTTSLSDRYIWSATALSAVSIQLSSIAVGRWF